MAQIFDPLPSNSIDPIVCCYVNATNKIQVARITNVPNWYFERVVFPGQRLIFEAIPTAQLEIHCGMMASAILSDTIPCDRLKLEGEESESDTHESSDSDSGNVLEPEVESHVASADRAPSIPHLNEPDLDETPLVMAIAPSMS